VEVGAGVEVREAAADDLVHRPDQAHLQDHRQAACRGADPAFAIEGLRRLIDRGLVALVASVQLFRQLLEFRLDGLHSALRDGLTAEERDRDGPDSSVSTTMAMPTFPVSE